jgi:UDP-N-acetylmuramyl pentapeptide synthase
VGVLTNASAAHLAQLDRWMKWRRQRAELAAAIPRDGLLVLNADDSRLWSLNSRAGPDPELRPG